MKMIVLCLIVAISSISNAGELESKKLVAGTPLFDHIPVAMDLENNEYEYINPDWEAGMTDDNSDILRYLTSQPRTHRTFDSLVVEKINTYLYIEECLVSFEWEKVVDEKTGTFFYTEVSRGEPFSCDPD